jgi:D-alanyl-D-alanine carboxypeptidase/D-alanyl-D-alanine-endopeptidase (penicillin-binding protein 4)
MRAALACCLAAAALASAGPALGATPPSEFAGTPTATRASATARAAILAGPLRVQLKRLMRGAGRASGAWVADLSGSAGLTPIFRRAAGKRRRLASNTKLFTTSTALVRFGPTGHLPTTAWVTGTLSNGVLTGNLVLRGGGDPELDAADIELLAARVKAAGLTQVTGRLLYDESFFDAKPGIPETGVSGGLGGTLTGLEYPGGARKAAADFVDALRSRGVTISSQVQSGQIIQGTSTQLATVDSPTMAQLIKDTNVPSNNFFAETLLKAVGAQFGGGGSTEEGLGVVRSFAAARGASLVAENGSGLSTRDRAAPAAVGRLLVSMLREQPAVSSAWTGSLAVAGQSGTLLKRMRGTAAAGRCHAKTGTLSGVSALSGYCFAAGHTEVFSILMNKVSITRAHLIQDRMAALIARYQP